MIKQTAEIFELLSKGGFISSDSTDPHIRQLYNQIDGTLRNSMNITLRSTFSSKAATSTIILPAAKPVPNWNVSWKSPCGGSMCSTLSKRMIMHLPRFPFPAVRYSGASQTGCGAEGEARRTKKIYGKGEAGRDTRKGTERSET